MARSALAIQGTASVLQETDEESLASFPDFYLADSCPALPTAGQLDAMMSRMGYVVPSTLHARLLELTEVPVIEISAGTGWGKTAAALYAARQSIERGETVRFFGGGAHSFEERALLPGRDRVRWQKPSGTHRVVYVIDGQLIPTADVQRLLDRLDRDSDARAVVTARSAHPLAAASRANGLLTATVGAEHLKFGRRELLGVARRHGVGLPAKIADHVVGVFHGWPLALIEFVRLYERNQARRSDISVNVLEDIVVETSRRIVDVLLGSEPPSDLALAAVADRIDRRALGPLAISTAFDESLDRIYSLGLGRWGY